MENVSFGISQFLGSQYEKEDELEYELPPYNVYMKYADIDPYKELINNIKNKLRSKIAVTLEHTKLKQRVLSLLVNGYDYRNLYDSNCDTAIYYFLEDIVLEFDNLDEDEEYYPYGWIDIYPILAKLGIKLPSFGGEGGKYGRSYIWE